MNFVAVVESLAAMGSAGFVAWITRKWDEGSGQLVWLTGSAKKTNVFLRTVIPGTIMCLGAVGVILGLLNPFS